jgi:hypothetical protein
MYDNTYNCSSDASNANVTLVPEDNAMVVTADNVDSIFISESSRIRWGILTLSGHAEGISHNMSINNEIIWTSIPSADTNVTGRRLMGCRAGYAIVRFERSELEFEFVGNLFTRMANLFHDNVLPIVMGNVEESLAMTINDVVPENANALF